MAKKLESNGIVNPEIIVRDLAMDLLKVPQIHRLFVNKRHLSNEEKTIEEWNLIFTEYGII